jgi:PHD/YefM family antitoxin component YafN of YafNO toxin-antitoxin module
LYIYVRDAIVLYTGKMDVVVLHKKKDYVLLPKEKYDSMKSTIEVLKDRELMKQLRESGKAKSRPFDEVIRELDL